MYNLSSMYNFVVGSRVVEAEKIANRYLDSRYQSMISRAKHSVHHSAGLVLAVMRLAVEVFTEGTYQAANILLQPLLPTAMVLAGISVLGMPHFAIAILKKFTALYPLTVEILKTLPVSTFSMVPSGIGVIVAATVMTRLMDENFTSLGKKDFNRHLGWLLDPKTAALADIHAYKKQRVFDILKHFGIGTTVIVGIALMGVAETVQLHKLRRFFLSQS